MTGPNLKFYLQKKSIGYQLGTSLVQNTSECLEKCLIANDCNGFFYYFNDSSLICELKTQINYPLDYISDFVERYYTTVIFLGEVLLFNKRILKYTGIQQLIAYFLILYTLDKELSVCGDEITYIEHSVECIEFLWKKHGCLESGFSFKENFERWISNSSTKDIRNHMMSVLLPPVYFMTEQTLFNKSTSYRINCFGQSSSGYYNIAAYKDTIILSSILQDDKYHHSHAVDRTLQGNPNLGSCTVIPSPHAWIAIDLKQIYEIRTIEINPPNCCSKFK